MREESDQDPRARTDGLKWGPTSAGGNLLSLLRIGDFCRLWVCDGLMFQGLWMEGLVIGWLTLEMTNSAFWVAAIDFCRAIPVPLVGLFGPLVTERFQRRRVIVLLQGVATLALVGVTILYLTGALVYWHLAAAAAVSGTSWALDWPSRRSFIPDLVGKSRVVDGMLLQNAMQALARISGPLLGGSALALIGTGGALVILVLMAGVSFVLLLGIESEARSPEPPRGVSQALARVAEGLRYVRGQRVIYGILVITLVMNVWAFPFQSLLPVFARDVLARGPVGLGLLTAANGVGALLGLVCVTRIRQEQRNARIFVVGSFICCLGLVAFAAADGFVIAAAMLAVAGLGQAGFSTMQSSILLVESPDHMRNRVMGTLVCAIGMGPFGRIQAGSLATFWGAPTAVASMAGFAVAANLVAVALLRGFVRPEHEPADQRL